MNLNIPLALILLVAATSVFWYVGERENRLDPRACTLEARLCPDGSVVTRGGPQCEFAECPKPKRAVGIAFDLTNRELVEIPERIFKAQDLEALDASYNELETISPRIGQLKELRVLSLSHNALIALPIEIGELTHLEILNLSYNELTDLPPELTHLKRLKILDISGNAALLEQIDAIRQLVPRGTEIRTGE